jgi:hypothetical protein
MIDVNYHEIVPELSKACYAIRSVRPFISFEALRMIYFSSVHLLKSYDNILGYFS